FRARRLAIDGTRLATATYPAEGFDSNKIALFDVSGTTPVFLQTITHPNNVRDIVIKNDVLYVAAGSFYAYDLTATPPAGVSASAPCGNAYAVAVDGSYAYLAGDCGGARVTIYDISKPKVPVKVRDIDTGSCCQTYRQLIPYGNYLVGMPPDSASGRGWDVVVMDRRDINNVVQVGNLDIPNFSGFRGTIIGTTLYESDGVAGSSGHLAVVDLSNPKTPT